MMTSADTRVLPQPPYHLLSSASLFLDLDGTLIEFASRPDAVTVDNSLISLLKRLRSALADRVVVVSGRPAAVLRSLLHDMDIAVSGSHGVEMLLTDGREERPAPVCPPDRVFDRLGKLSAQYPGVLVETKPFGLALHYRMATGAAAACQAAAETIAAAEGYDLQPGNHVIEIKFQAVSKGDAVRQFMALAPFKTGMPLFMGDDFTDEAGFAAATELGGAGILVGPARPTHAAYSLPDVGLALRWLEGALAGLR